jgi:GalNAc-alpha-(1->4)-GalNAc-alpha-(1->3)-diNAcBac-PP-undecaprenol alpha-1,4-N-acetyl-D-galactosaminyltransferase
MNNTSKKIVLMTADLGPGGTERVVSILANKFVENYSVDVCIICLVQGEVFYQINPKVKILRPSFNYRNYPKFISYLITFFYVRKKLKVLNPTSILYFGGRYNSLCILASLGLTVKTYISERSKPGISYGFFIDFLNMIFYPLADGLIVQTKQANDFFTKHLKIKRIKVIGNPVPDLYDPAIERRNVILNVGRFIQTKNQQLLIDIFDEINPVAWELWFVGQGPMLNFCKEKASNFLSGKRIVFLDKISNVKEIYNSAKVFAFTSTSEGFPNALAEAMSAGLACISFDCVAGPSELIEDEFNGFLVKNFDTIEFRNKLNILIQSPLIRENFAKNAMATVKRYSENKIVDSFYKFIN